MGVSSFGKVITNAFQTTSLQMKHIERQSVDENNILELGRAAQVEDLNAVNALSRGSFTAGLVRRKASQAIQEQRLAFSASGVDSGYGTPLDLEATTRAYSEADAMQYLGNAAREAWGYRTVASQYRKKKQRIEDRQSDLSYAAGMETAGLAIDTAASFVDAFLPSGGGQ